MAGENDAIIEKLLDVVERLARIEDKVEKIEEHTGTMNNELGECMKSVKACQESLEKLQKKRLSKLLNAIKSNYLVIAGMGTVVTIIIAILTFLHL